MADRIDRAGTRGYEEVFEEIEYFVDGLSRTTPDERNDQFFVQLGQAKTNLNRIKDVITQDLFNRVQRKIDILYYNNNNEVEHGSESFKLQKIVNGKPGNNCYDIDKDYLEHLLSIGCHVTSIARDGMLGSKLHPNTIYKFMKRNGIKSVRDRFTTLSDEELTLLVKDINSKFPNSGIREVKAILKNLTPPVIVQRDRVGKILSTVDPHGAARRWAQVIPRRVYRVATPNSLWHIDTHHSLIRLVIGNHKQ